MPLVTLVLCMKCDGLISVDDVAIEDAAKRCRCERPRLRATPTRTCERSTAPEQSTALAISARAEREGTN